MIDIAIAVEQIYGVADYGSASTYEELQRTWRDDRPIPSLEQLEEEWAQYQARPAIPTDSNYRAFFFALLTSSSYQHVLLHSAQNIACNAAMTVLIASMNALMLQTYQTPEQWAGLQNAFQASVNQLVAALNEAQVPFSAEHIAEIQAMRSGAGLIFTLPGES